MDPELETGKVAELGQSPVMTSNTPDLPTMNDLWQSTLDWQPSDAQQQQFQRLYHHILIGNRKFNLTRITDPVDFWEKHLWDSLRGIGVGVMRPGLVCGDAEPKQGSHTDGDQASFDQKSTFPTSPYKVIDIGTGAGFPGLPVAIAQPTWHVTLLDATRKKLAFIESILPDLNVPKVKLWVGRAEEIGHLRHHREHYHLVLLRAVAPASVCAEYALPLLKQDGVAVLYRGQWSQDEQQKLEAALQLLGGAIAQIDAFTTPISQSIRHCVIVTKVASTDPEFPRAVGIPAKDPL